MCVKYSDLIKIYGMEYKILILIKIQNFYSGERYGLGASKDIRNTASSEYFDF